MTPDKEARAYDVVAGGHALKLHLLFEPDGKLEDVALEPVFGSISCGPES